MVCVKGYVREHVLVVYLDDWVHHQVQQCIVQQANVVLRPPADLTSRQEWRPFADETILIGSGKGQGQCVLIRGIQTCGKQCVDRV